MRNFIIGLVATLSVLAPLTLAAAPAEAVTGPQRQAIGMAYDYLDTMPFSKAGLYHQLRYEGFSRYVSDYAVNHISVSWRYQAVRMGRSYLSVMHFSCSGLIRQLDYERFVHWQSVYGAYHTRAC
jgi:hypothetical protein